MNLPEFPELPASLDSRIRWASWGQKCFEAGMERAAKICEAEAEGHRTAFGEHCAAVIRVKNGQGWQE